MELPKPKQFIATANPATTARASTCTSSSAIASASGLVKKSIPIPRHASAAIAPDTKSISLFCQDDKLMDNKKRTRKPANDGLQQQQQQQQLEFPSSNTSDNNRKTLGDGSTKTAFTHVSLTSMENPSIFNSFRTTTHTIAPSGDFVQSSSSVGTTISTVPADPRSVGSSPAGSPLKRHISNQKVFSEQRNRSPSLGRGSIFRNDDEKLLGLRRDVIYEMRKKEEQYRPNVSYLENQEKNKKAMRATLIDWLMEVAQEYILRRQTLHFAISYIDRYLSKVSVKKEKLQLLGVTALWLAAKVEEIFPPRVEEFAQATDGACQSHDIRVFETVLMQELDWRLCPITVSSWVICYIQEIYALEGFAKSNTSTIQNAAVSLRRHSSCYGIGFSARDFKDVNKQDFYPEVADFAAAFSIPNTSINLPPSGFGSSSNSNSSSSNNSRMSSPCFVGSQTPPMLNPSNWKTYSELKENPEFYALPANIDVNVVQRVMEIVDFVMLDVHFVSFLPSMIAATAILLYQQSNPEMEYPTRAVIELVTKYTDSELAECMAWMRPALLLPENPTFFSQSNEYLRNEVPVSDLFSLQRYHPGALRLFKKYMLEPSSQVYHHQDTSAQFVKNNTMQSRATTAVSHSDCEEEEEEEDDEELYEYVDDDDEPETLMNEDSMGTDYEEDGRASMVSNTSAKLMAPLNGLGLLSASSDSNLLVCMSSKLTSVNKKEREQISPDLVSSETLEDLCFSYQQA